MYGAHSRYADQDPYALVDFPTPAKVSVKKPRSEQRKIISSVKGRNKRAFVKSLNTVTDEDIANSYYAMYEEHNRLFLVFNREVQNPGDETGRLITLIGSRHDKRPYNALYEDKSKKKDTTLNAYGLRLWRRGKQLGVDKVIKDRATLLTLTVSPKLLAGLLEVGFRECHEHGDKDAIAQRALTRAIVRAEQKAERERALKDKRKPQVISAKKLKLPMPSPWKPVKRGKKLVAYKPTLPGRIAMLVCDKLETLNLTHESLSLREQILFLFPIFQANFLRRYYKYADAHGEERAFVVAGVEPHKKTGLPHAHLVFNAPFVAPMELLTEWWPYGGIVPKSSGRKGFRSTPGLAKNAIAYAIKYVLKAATEAVEKVEVGTSGRTKTVVSMFYAYTWYYALRLYNFAHNLPVPKKERVWLCIGISNGVSTYIFSRYRDDYKDSGTDWTESDPDPPPERRTTSFSLSEAEAFIESLSARMTN